MNKQKTERRQTQTDESQGIEIRQLSVSAGEKALLERTDAHFKRGQITLIVGPSGVGKSILLKMIAGILDSAESAIKGSGKILINGKKSAAGDVGVVFQSFALFDELSPKQNIDYAKSSGRKNHNQLSVEQLLQKLQVPTDVPTSRLSGGQQQRLAIARTIAYNPPIIVYDEPTSGLDPATGRKVANLIRDTHLAYGDTTLIVTHDYLSLTPIADRIFLLDPGQKKLIEIEEAEWSTLPETLEKMSDRAMAKELPTSESLVNKVVRLTASFFGGTTDWLFSFLICLFSLIPTWSNPKWGLRYLWHYCRMVFGPTALIYLIMSGVISGFVTTFFTFKFLPFATYTEPLLIEDLLIGLGFATYRIFVPVLGCVLIAARCGAAVTSDIGGRQFGNQIDAMKSFKTSPRAYLLTPIIWSFLIGTPVLYGASFLAARFTSLITFVYTFPERGPDFWYENFHRGLIVVGQDWYRGTGWLLAKLLCSGFGIAMISYFLGRKPKFSSSDVSRSITTTILVATLYVLTVHFLFALFEYEGIVPGATTPESNMSI